MKSKTIKLETLIELNACAEQVNLFKETFGDSVELTTTIAKKFGSKFSIGWAANNLLNEEQLNAYQEANVPLWNTYIEAKAPLWKAYEEAIAFKAYKEAIAVEFAKIYIG